MKVLTERKIGNAVAGAKKALALSEKADGLSVGKAGLTPGSELSERIKPFSAVVEVIAKEEGAMVVTSENKSACSEFAVRVKKLARTLDDKRSEFKRPYLESERAIDALFMPLIRQLKTIEQNAGKKLTVVLTAERRLAEEAANKAAKEAYEKAQKESLKDGLSKRQAAQVAEEVSMVVHSNIAQSAPAGMMTAAGSSQLKKKKDFEVVDISMVPADFLVVDRSKVMAAIASGATEIPGLKIIETEGVQFRSK